MAYESYTIAELTAIYNEHADKPVKKFSSKAVALDRVLAMAAEKGLSITGLLPAKGGEAGEDTRTPEQAVVDEVLGPDTEEASPEAEPEPVRKGPPTPYEIQQARKAKRSRGGTATGEAAPRAEGGRVAQFQEGAVIHILKPIGARDGSFRAQRAAVLKEGITVGEYLDGAHAANNGKRPRHRYMADIRRYVEGGFIKVGE